ncbi:MULTISPECIES: ureidoglycolate lyase [Achromobacter]|uniref:Ureidoglycolate hydrolase n=1 Tax=Achromobacter aegrifaciens TaxID=1287736 RepID=A0AAD2J666_ACHAE|nr:MULTISPECIES: ureidoglycolate lyase [Achromobacter]MBD9433459.1 ureidoglycolate lyase [Achromobacter sp. ACM03]MDR7947939.1 ureidoglycolate lyase [Achromobacter aegrifaciens]RIJ00093.1 ureidoglycolate hydrolase [Achromobacter sp. K91]RSE90879.1 ureidoglycolate hydrolase [Achromobacter aegrifaciens]CAB3714371.1 Ureidoglycolate lyase [Achromobacter aegrifaciens]
MAAHTLIAQPLAAAAFAPYGEVVSSAGRAGRSINAGTSLRVEMGEPDLLDAGGRPSLSVFRAQAIALPFAARMLERHRLGSQTFLPLAGTPYVVLVALGAEAPDLATLRAFMAGAGVGITLRRDVWHHPLMALADGEFAVLERAGPTVDCEVIDLPDAPWTIQAA